MENEDVEKILNGIDAPKTDQISHQEDLIIPLLRYKRSSKMGLLLLVLPLIIALTSLLKHELALSWPILNGIAWMFASVDGSPVLTFLVPVVVLGLPCAAMVVNVLAFCHFGRSKDRKELVITVKYRPVNIGVFLFSFALLVFFFLPDVLSF